MIGLRLAVVFLTRLPVAGSKPIDAPFGRAVPWLPAVGLVIGAAAGGVYAGLWHVLPPLAAAGATLGFTLLVTGALHHDGLADVFDGFVGGHTVERRLEIMRDSRLGTYGTSALLVVLGLQWVCIAVLGPLQGFVALLAAHGVGRVAAVALMVSGRPARREGLGSASVEGLRRGPALAAAILVAVVAGAAAGAAGVALVAAPIVPVVLLAVWARRAIGGVTGDVLGAVEQLAETSVLLVAAALVRGEVSWPW